MPKYGYKYRQGSGVAIQLHFLNTDMGSVYNMTVICDIMIFIKYSMLLVESFFRCCLSASKLIFMTVSFLATVLHFMYSIEQPQWSVLHSKHLLIILKFTNGSI